MMNFLKKNKSYKNSAEDKLDLIISLLSGECKSEPVAEMIENQEPVENAEETSDTVDKRQLIDEVGGFLKSKGLTDEDIRYVIGLMEKEAYEKSSYENSSETIEEKPTEKQIEEPKETTTVSQEQVNQETQQETKEETIQQPIKEAEKKEYENSFEGENNFLLLKDRVKYGNSLF